MAFLHLARRKLATFLTTARACSNWPQLALAKLNLGAERTPLKFRDGLRLEPLSSLRETWGEIFEPAIADLYGIRRCKPDLIVDVGANIGAFSCLAAHLHPSARVHSFEPSVPHGDQLLRNAALNRLENIELHRSPVTGDGRNVCFSIRGSGGASGIFFQEGGQPVQLTSVSLDTIDFSAAQHLFLKLDCEGAEGEIIPWMCFNVSMLPRKVTLACEYHHWCPVPMEALLRELREHGFRAEEKTLFDEPYIFATRTSSSHERIS